MSGAWLEFIEIPNPGRKTRVWKVMHKDRDPGPVGERDGFLGEIRFYPPWRQYCFHPKRGTIWSRSCMVQINEFIEAQMAERKAA